MVDAASAWKLGSLAFKLLARASGVRDHEPLATFLAVTERLQEKIERDSDQWLRSEFGSELAKQADALVAIAALDDILSRSLPDGLSVAQANLSPDRIADRHQRGALGTHLAHRREREQRDACPAPARHRFAIAAGGCAGLGVRITRLSTTLLRGH